MQTPDIAQLETAYKKAKKATDNARRYRMKLPYGSPKSEKAGERVSKCLEAEQAAIKALNQAKRNATNT